MKKLIIIAVIILIIAGILLGVNFKNTKENTGETNSQDKVAEKETFILGLDDSFPPMGYRNENNEIVGFDIDVAKEVCNRLNMELKLQPISWAAKVEELNSKNIDCIWNGMSVDDERKQIMNLSESYMKNSLVLVVINSSEYKTIKDLKDKKIGVQTGSISQEVLEASEFYEDIEMIGYNDYIVSFMDMEIGQIEAVFVDEVLANYYIASQNKNYVVLEERMAEDEFAIGFRKDDSELRNKVQNTLEEMKADGKLGEISTKWFGKDITIIKTGN